MKLDDGFFRHRKVVDLSKDAKLLFVAGLTYAAEQLTDGYLSPGALRMVAGLYADVPEDTAKELVEVGLWLVAGEGLRIGSYLDFNPTAEEELDRRQKRAEAGRKGGIRSGASRRTRSNAEANGEANASSAAKQRGKQNGTPSPSPSPSPYSPGSVSEERPPPRMRGEEEDRCLSDAALVIAHRRLERRDPKKPAIVDQARWLESVAAERATEHRSAALALLEVRPDTTPAELAYELEPDLRPPAQRRPLCGECENGLVEVEGGAYDRCPCQLQGVAG